MRPGKERKQQQQALIHSKVSCVYFPKIRCSPMKASCRPLNQETNTAMIQLFNQQTQFKFVTLVPMKFCLSSLRSFQELSCQLSLISLGSPPNWDSSVVFPCLLFPWPGLKLFLHDQTRSYSLAEILQERCCVFFSTLYQGCVFIHHTLGACKTYHLTLLVSGRFPHHVNSFLCNYLSFCKKIFWDDIIFWLQWCLPPAWSVIVT